jgi:uncharacterized protein (DUF849 family)
MRFSEQKKVVLAVGANESVPRSLNPHVPFTADEVVADAIACARAGASLYHFHARHPDGTQAFTDDGIYRDAMRRIGQEVDLLTFPTGYPGKIDPADPAAVPHWWAITSDPEVLEPKFLPFDFWRLGRNGVPVVHEGKLVNPAVMGSLELAEPWSLPPVLAAMFEHEAVPIFMCTHPAEVRWTLEVARAGFIPQPVMVQFHLFAYYPMSSSPTPRAIDSYIAEWDPAVDAEFFFCVQGMTDRGAFDEINSYALERGLGVRCGLGDNPAATPTMSNPELTIEAVDWVRSKGYEPVTTQEIRERLGWATRELAA